MVSPGLQRRFSSGWSTFPICEAPSSHQSVATCFVSAQVRIALLILQLQNTSMKRLSTAVAPRAALAPHGVAWAAAQIQFRLVNVSYLRGTIITPVRCNLFRLCASAYRLADSTATKHQHEASIDGSGSQGCAGPRMVSPGLQRRFSSGWSTFPICEAPSSHQSVATCFVSAQVRIALLILQLQNTSMKRLSTAVAPRAALAPAWCRLGCSADSVQVGQRFLSARHHHHTSPLQPVSSLRKCVSPC